MRYYTSLETPLGTMVLAGPAGDVSSREAGTLALAYFVDQRYAPHLDDDWSRNDTVLHEAARQFGEYYEGSRTSFDLALAFDGSEFQRSVWRLLLEIPYGMTWSYGDLALKVADRSKTRAVAAAVGRNPLGVVVPCHRVIGADGSLTGFAAGIERKRWLLDHEAAVLGRGQAPLFAG